MDDEAAPIRTARYSADPENAAALSVVESAAETGRSLKGSHFREALFNSECWSPIDTVTVKHIGSPLARG
jgi:hypothetical protein